MPIWGVLYFYFRFIIHNSDFGSQFGGEEAGLNLDPDLGAEHIGQPVHQAGQLLPVAVGGEQVDIQIARLQDGPQVGLQAGPQAGIPPPPQPVGFAGKILCCFQ